MREGASMVAVGDKIMIFGGNGARQRFNDLHILDAKVNSPFIAVDRNCSNIFNLDVHEFGTL